MFRIALLLISLSAGFQAVHAEKATPAKTQENAGQAISLTQIKAKIDDLKNQQGIDEAKKTEIMALYHSMEESLTNLSAFAEKTLEYETATKQGSEKIKKLHREIEAAKQKLAKQKVEDFTRISVEELEQRLILEKEKIAALDEQIKALDKSLAEQNDRPQKIREETIAAQLALEEAQKKRENPASSTLSKLEREARTLQVNAIISTRTAELKMLPAEANSNPIRIELLKTELQSLNAQKDSLSPVVANIEDVLNSRRQQDAINMQNAISEAEKKVSGKHSLIQQATRENAEFSRDLQTISTKIEQYSERKNKAEESAKEIEDDFKSAEKKIGLAGLSPVLGKILREQRRNLAGEDQFIEETRAIQDETALTSLEQFKIEDRLKSLANMDAYIKGLMAGVEKTVQQNNRMMVQAELRTLLNNQKEILNKLSAADTTYLRTLGDYDFANQQLLSQSNKFADYLDERLLWVKSSAPINSGFLGGLFDSVMWLLSPQNWVALIKDTVQIALNNPLLTFLTVLISGVLPFMRTWAKRQLLAIAEKIEKIYTDNFSYTPKAFAYTLILVLPLPVFVFILGWFLSGELQGTHFSKTVGEGLQNAAVPLFVAELLYRIFAANGMAIKHFQWQKESARLFQRQVAWLRFVIVPGVFLISATGASDIASHSDHLGRLALVGNMVALSLFFTRLLHPSKGLLTGYIQSHPDDWFSKLRYIWYSVIIAIPMIIVGFSVSGYYLSALELQQKLGVTLLLVFLMVIIYGMVIRWLTFVNRKLALKNAKQKRKTAAAAQSEKQQASSEGVGVGDDVALPIDEQLIDIPTLNAQTIKLLIVFIGFSMIVGLWMIWSNILPAFSFLENIVLWQHQVMVDDKETMQPVTLKNLLMAGLYGFIVVVAVRNFSGVMELFLFSRITVAAGGRYAVNQLAKYLIITIGFLCIANELGGSWSQVQWLVAALSVGLGFGLQEIFANLVSGIILLFERPIRVGDTVTISNVTGKVSRIQMRATTLIDPDQKELVVPNKNFITSQLVNWTLSDSTTRIIFPIYIAYGTDVDLAHKVMIETVKATPLVLEEPSPGVVFTGFGVDALEFSIRAYVSELGNRLPVTHNLHINLEKALAENNIKMPK